jgi:hypothetical protein
MVTGAACPAVSATVAAVVCDTAGGVVPGILCRLRALLFLL